MNNKLIEQLIESLRCLPGVGPKSAQRMAFHLLQHQRDSGLKLAHSLTKAIENIIHCSQCNNFTDSPLCFYCRQEQRNKQLLCVVEMPSDITNIEQTGVYNGYYYVLMGHLSPIDGIGPEEIGAEKLVSMVQSNHTREVILALNPTIESDATMHYLSELLKPLGIKTSRLAHGVPIGSELEYLDGNTLGCALTAREVL